MHEFIDSFWGVRFLHIIPLHLDFDMQRPLKCCFLVLLFLKVQF